jgi:hypothetical protein
VRARVFVSVVFLLMLALVEGCVNPFQCVGVGDGCTADHGTWHDDGGTCGWCEYPPEYSSPSYGSSSGQGAPSSGPHAGPTQDAATDGGFDSAEGDAEAPPVTCTDGLCVSNRDG